MNKNIKIATEPSKPVTFTTLDTIKITKAPEVDIPTPSKSSQQEDLIARTDLRSRSPAKGCFKKRFSRRKTPTWLDSYEL